jgi:uncharacterized lipoprotein YddW (UPF0748 family)
MDLNTSVLSPTHDFYKHPEWMIKYGGKYYYNPALPEVQTHLIEVVDEVVKIMILTRSILMIISIPTK